MLSDFQIAHTLQNVVASLPEGSSIKMQNITKIELFQIFLLKAIKHGKRGINLLR